MNVSSFSLMFLNIERYISIVFPIYHHTKVTRKKVVMFLPIVWILGIAEVAFACSAFTSENGVCAFGNQKLFDIGIVFFYCCSLLSSCNLSIVFVWTYFYSPEKFSQSRK